MAPPTLAIARSTRKTGLFAAFMLLLACVSLYMAYDAEHIVLNGVYNPALVRLIGISGAALLGALGALFINQLRSKTPGLELNAKGFIDNTSGAAAGLVAWEDVVGLQEVKIGFARFIAVMLRDPAKYIARPTTAATRQLFASYQKTYGSPILLSTTMLQCSPDELKNLLAARLTT
jgi:hypothetical protein